MYPIEIVCQKKEDLPKSDKVLSDFMDPEFKEPLYNIWKRQEKTKGSSHFGNSDTQWLQNLLYLYTTPFDIVIDPFAGGGSTIDVCKQFMRRIERMVAAHEGKKQDLVKFIAHQTCINPIQIRQLIRVLDLKEKICVNTSFQEDPQPTILVEALPAPDPVALATKAIEEEWTAKQVREEAARPIYIVWSDEPLIAGEKVPVFPDNA